MGCVSATWDPVVPHQDIREGSSKKQERQGHSGFIRLVEVCVGLVITATAAVKEEPRGSEGYPRLSDTETSREMESGHKGRKEGESPGTTSHLEGH